MYFCLKEDVCDTYMQVKGKTLVLGTAEGSINLKMSYIESTGVQNPRRRRFEVQLRGGHAAQFSYMHAVAR